MRLVDTAEFARGRAGEERIERYLARDGYYVLSTRDFKTAYDAAPRIHGPADAIICPDTLTFKYGQALWLDTKTKKEPMIFRKEDREEHGIDAHCGQAYLRIESETGIPVWIVVYEETRHGTDSGVALCGRLRSLLVNVRKSPRSYNYRPMWNFLRRDFSEVNPQVSGGFDRAFFGTDSP